jgi:hypothetical protein
VKVSAQLLLFEQLKRCANVADPGLEVDELVARVLLSSVRSAVFPQVAAVREGLGTSHEKGLSPVWVLRCLTRSPLCEGLGAEVARVRFLARVSSAVSVQVAALREGLGAHVAREGLLARVGSAVEGQVAAPREGLRADVVREWLLNGEPARERREGDGGMLNARRRELKVVLLLLLLLLSLLLLLLLLLLSLMLAREQGGGTGPRLRIPVPASVRHQERVIAKDLIAARKITQKLYRVAAITQNNTGSEGNPSSALPSSGREDTRSSSISSARAQIAHFLCRSCRLCPLSILWCPKKKKKKKNKHRDVAPSKRRGRLRRAISGSMESTRQVKMMNEWH